MTTPSDNLLSLEELAATLHAYEGPSHPRPRRDGCSTRRSLPATSLRRAALALAAVLVVGGAAVPAFGFGKNVIDFFTGQSAPQVTQKLFFSLDVGAPSGMAPGISGPARSVLQTTIDGRVATLWVAPTQQGGFCFLLDRFAGGCDRDRSLPLSFGIGRFTANGPQELNGDVLGSEATSVRVDYQDGGSVAVPLTTISTPINAGFFVFDIPMAHRVAGHRPAALTALAADGSTVATKQLPTSAP
jgi:hypothetical protein